MPSVHARVSLETASMVLANVFGPSPTKKAINSAISIPMATGMGPAKRTHPREGEQAERLPSRQAKRLRNKVPATK
jgi:hypothetical protein